jgi:ferritin
MLSPKLQEALNDQINMELKASYIYLAMSAWCDARNFLGCAKWLRMQSEEEYAHAMKFFDGMREWGGEIKLHAITEPPQTWKDLLDLFQSVYQHECKVSKSINDIYAIALDERAFPPQSLLQYFVNEQVEEENSAHEIVSKLEFVKNDPAALLALDRELGVRPGGGEAAQ